VHLGGGRGVGLDPTPELGHSCPQVGQGGWKMLPEVCLHSNNMHLSQSSSVCAAHVPVL